MEAIEIRNVSVSYGNVMALENINLKVKDKQFLGIIGPNGAGKSTLLKVILGLIKPDVGYVKIFGKMLPNNKSRVGYVPQASNFNKKFPISVLEVVLMGRLKNQKLFFHRFSKHDYEVAEYYLAKLGIHDVKNRQIGQLSGGQLQKVLIARALVLEPQIMLLDEPTASVDIFSRSNILDLLKELNQYMTIVVVTHDLTAVSSYFDSIACLNKTLNYHGKKEFAKEKIKNVFGYQSI